MTTSDPSATPRALTTTGVTPTGVTIIVYTALAGRLPAQASQPYGTNLLNLVKLLTPGRDGRLVLDLDDVVQRAVTVVRDGEVLRATRRTHGHAEVHLIDADESGRESRKLHLARLSRERHPHVGSGRRRR